MRTSVIVAILLCSGLNSHAVAQSTYGDWFVVRADDGSGDVIAATSTDGSGTELLGYRCFAASQKCLHVLIPNTGCEDEGRYPMLLNAASGSSMVTGLCYKTEKSDQLLLTPFESIRSPIEQDSGLLGFAIPMKSGAFKAVRFSLKGSKAATAAAERIMRNTTPARPASGIGSTTF